MSTYRARVIAEGVALQSWQCFDHDTQNVKTDVYRVAVESLAAFVGDQQEAEFDAPDAIVLVVEKVPELGQ